MAWFTTTLQRHFQKRSTLDLTVVGLVLCAGLVGLWVGDGGASSAAAGAEWEPGLTSAAVAPLSPAEEAAVPESTGPTLTRPSTATSLEASSTTEAGNRLDRQPTAEETEQFEGLLADAELVAADLDDDALNQLGLTMCFLATVSPDASGFDTNRSDTINELVPPSPLTDDELAYVIDAAVVAYCPAEAERLGVSV